MTSGDFPVGTDVTTWPSDPAGWSFARTYSSGGNTYVVLLRQHSGDLDIYSLGANSIGSRVATYNLRTWWTGAEVFTPAGGSPTLVLHDSDTGAIRTYLLNSDGTLGTRSDTSHASWVGKNLFSVFQEGSTWYFYGLNTRTGSTTMFTSAGSQVTTSSVTSGWTSMDHVRIGSDTYRVLYKGGDFPGNQGGRLQIDLIDSSGNIATTVVSEAASESAEGWTTVRFYTAGGNTYLLRYDASNGTTSGNRRIDQFNGSALSAVTTTDLDPGWTDFEPYTIGSTTYMLTLNEEGIDRINGKEIDAIVASLQSGLEPNIFAGYQFAIAQSGRVLYERAWGSQDLGATASGDEVAMTVDAHTNVGSVSKVITTMSVLKLADMGEIDLDTPQQNYLDYDANPGLYDGSFAMHDDLKGWTARDYATYATNLTGSVTPCGATTTAGPVDLSGCLSTGSSGSCPSNTATDGQLCDRSYINANFTVLRSIVEYVSLTASTSELVQYVRDLWMDRIGMSTADCMVPGGAQMVGHDCTAGSCTAWDRFPLGDSFVCGAGGWKATPREMLRFARAIRYEHIIGPELTRELLSTAHQTGDGTPTSMAWNNDYTDDAAAPEVFQCKSGGVTPSSGGAFRTEFCVGNKSVDLYLAANQTGSGIITSDPIRFYNAGN